MTVTNPLCLGDCCHRSEAKRRFSKSVLVAWLFDVLELPRRGNTFMAFRGHVLSQRPQQRLSWVADEVCAIQVWPGHERRNQGCFPEGNRGWLLSGRGRALPGNIYWPTLPGNGKAQRAHSMAADR